MMDLSDDEVTGVVERAFMESVDEDRTPFLFTIPEYDDIEAVVGAVRVLLRRHQGRARAAVRARLLTAVGEGA